MDEIKAVWHEEDERMNWPCRKCGRCELGAWAMKEGGLCAPCAVGAIQEARTAADTPAIREGRA